MRCFVEINLVKSLSDKVCFIFALALMKSELRNSSLLWILIFTDFSLSSSKSSNSTNFPSKITCTYNKLYTSTFSNIPLSANAFTSSSSFSLRIVFITSISDIISSLIISKSIIFFSIFLICSSNLFFDSSE